METSPQLTDEVLLITFAYLRLPEIKCCRLVCTQWKRCTKHRSIAGKYKYVFRSGVCPIAEINRVLADHDGGGIHVEFVGVKLKQLNATGFGRKIRTLQITDCNAETVQPVTRILRWAPNLERFDCHLAEEDHTTRKFLKKFTTDLRASASKFENVKQFECVNGETWDEDMRVDLPIKELFEIFPRVDSLRFPTIDLDYLSTNGLPIKSDLKELSGASLYACDDLSPLLQDFFISMPKLRKLDIKLECDRESVSHNSFLALLSLQTELETLSVKLDCDSAQECDHWPERDIGAGNENTCKRCPAKRVLLHALANCKRLKSLRFFVECEADLHLNEVEGRRFDRALSTSSLRELALSTIAFDSGSFASHFSSPKALKCLEITKSSDSLGSPDPTLTSGPLCEDIVQILETQKNLQKLTVNVHVRAFNDADTKTASTGNPSFTHSKLEHLEFSLSTWTIAIVRCLLSWKFPKLHALSLISPSRAWSLSARLRFSAEAKNDVVNWIKTMPTLTHARIRWFRLRVDECTELCEQLPALQSIEFESTKRLKEQQVKKLFVNCPTLKDAAVWIHMRQSEYCEPTYYHANRSKKLVYIQELGNLGSINYVPIASL